MTTRISPAMTVASTQAVIAMAFDDDRHQADEGGGRAADLEAAAAQQGY